MVPMETMPWARDAGRVNTLASSTLPAVRERDHVNGSNSPRLTLVEYGDFRCPYCFAVSRPVKALLDRFDGVRLVWRHFSAPHLHPRADLAAELSELAGFWIQLESPCHGKQVVV